MHYDKLHNSHIIGAIACFSGIALFKKPNGKTIVKQLSKEKKLEIPETEIYAKGYYEQY